MQRPMLIIALLAVSSFLLGGALRGGDEPGATPTFQDEEAQRSFEGAKSLFEEGKWKEAEKLFRSCRKGTDRDGRKILKAWLAACKGGPKLAAVDKAIARGSWKSAWGKVERLNASYRETPLRERIDALARRVEKELFTPLATFEESPPESEKAVRDRRPTSAEINEKPELVRGGRRSLRWRESVGFGHGKVIGVLPISSFEGAWIKEHRFLRVSLHSEDEALGKFALFFDTGERIDWASADPTAILKIPGYFYHITLNKKGWVDLRIDLWKQVSQHSGVTWDQIEGLNLLIIPPSKPKTIHIDEVKLEKK
ncbi:MAG: hypothetical protein ACE5GW_07270 [Planctomycetota bacterium]